MALEFRAATANLIGEVEPYPLRLAGEERAQVVLHSLPNDRVDGDTSRMIVRLVGDTTHDVEYVWRNVGGRFRIVDVKRTE